MTCNLTFDGKTLTGPMDHSFTPHAPVDRTGFGSIAVPVHLRPDRPGAQKDLPLIGTLRRRRLIKRARKHTS
jgi:hypothetical protein